MTTVWVDELEQGSDAWRVWREQGVGGSEVAAIMGASPWETVETVWQRKTGRIPPVEVNAAMQRGMDLEPEARALLEWDRGIRFPPRCAYVQEQPFLRVSLDGWNNGTVAEFKVPGKTTHRKVMAKGGSVPKHYWPQVQYQLAVTNAHTCLFCSYNEEFGKDAFIIVEVQRDEAYIAKMLEAVTAFYRCCERDRDPLVGLLEQSLKGVYQPL